MVKLLMYKLIEYNKNKSLVRCIDWLKVETVHDITEISKGWTILLTFCFWYSYDLLTMNISFFLLLYIPIEQYINCLMMIRRSILFQRRFKLSSIVDIDRLFVTWKKVDWMLMSMWAVFSMWAKKLAAEKGI